MIDIGTRVDVLVTGVAGFVGFHLAKRLLENGASVVGVDNLNSYYDVELKKSRLALLVEYGNFSNIRANIADKDKVDELFETYRPRVVVHLAAQAGVRYSLENPDAYIQSNIVGFANILEGCRGRDIKHLVYASSSSVYGGNSKVPFSESDPVDHPVSLYAATKRANELMADTYSHLYAIPATGLRFFTVYGPMGRPDMAYFSFTKRHFDGEVIRLFNQGDVSNDLSRDFTYVDDVVESVVRILPLAPGGQRPHRVLNIGGSRPVPLTKFVEILEQSLSKSLGKHTVFRKVFEGPKPGDVRVTYADSQLLQHIVGYVPETALEVGLQRFTDWYVEFYGVGG